MKKVFFLLIFIYIFSFLHAQVVESSGLEGNQNNEAQSKETIWDEYLNDLSNTGNIIYLLNFNNLSWEDKSDLKNKYNFRKTMIYNTYSSENGEIMIRFNENYGKYDLREISFDPKQVEFPFPKLDQISTKADIEENFGLNYDQDKSGYTLLASSYDSEARKIDMTIKFDFGYDQSLTKVSFSKRNAEELKYEGNLYYIDCGSVSGNCESGRGIYQYSDGYWVDGIFKDGKLYRGVPQELDFVKRDAASIELMLEGAQYYNTADKSIWATWLQNDSPESIIHMFNKKDFKESDWQALLKNYFYSEGYTTYTSPTEKITITVTGNKDIIRSLLLRIDSVEDLHRLGFQEQMSYDDLAKRFGPEYKVDKAEYVALFLPKGNNTMDHYIEVHFGMNEDYTKIKTIFIDPWNEYKVEIPSTISFLVTGADPQPGINYRWGTGHWFKGSLKNGIPWNGTIYYFFDSNPCCYVDNGVVSDGNPPTILKQYNP